MHLFRLVFAFLCALGLALPALAQKRNAAEIAKLRMDIAGRQRLLSQRMTAAACFLTFDIDRERQLRILTESLELFRVALDQLETGAPAMGLPAVSTFSARIALHESRIIWGPYRDIATQIRDQAAAGDSGNIAQLGQLARLEPILLSTTQSVASALSKTHKPQSGTRITEIDLAGRQRMLSQAIVKESCLLSVAKARKESLASHLNQMRAKAALFEHTGYALRKGAIGTTPDPPLSDTFEALVQAHYSWSDLVYLLEPTESGTALPKLALLEVALSYEDLLPRLEEVVWTYVNG
jgi:hypothetical protein